MPRSKARMARIQQAWLGVPENWRTHIASALNTFISTFLTEITAMVATSSDFTFSRFALIGALNVAIRSVLVKPTTTAIGSRTLPDVTE